MMLVLKQHQLETTDLYETDVFMIHFFMFVSVIQEEREYVLSCYSFSSPSSTSFRLRTSREPRPLVSQRISSSISL